MLGGPPCLSCPSNFWDIWRHFVQGVFHDNFTIKLKFAQNIHTWFKTHQAFPEIVRKAHKIRPCGVEKLKMVGNYISWDKIKHQIFSIFKWPNGATVVPKLQHCCRQRGEPNIISQISISALYRLIGINMKCKLNSIQQSALNKIGLRQIGYKLFFIKITYQLLNLSKRQLVPL